MDLKFVNLVLHTVGSGQTAVFCKETSLYCLRLPACIVQLCHCIVHVFANNPQLFAKNLQAWNLIRSAPSWRKEYAIKCSLFISLTTPGTMAYWTGHACRFYYFRTKQVCASCIPSRLNRSTSYIPSRLTEVPALFFLDWTGMPALFPPRWMGALALFLLDWTSMPGLFIRDWHVWQFYFF